MGLFESNPMQWNPINLEMLPNYEMQMELPRSPPYQVDSVEVLICYTVKNLFGVWPSPFEKKYGIGYFWHDGDSWSCSLRFGNKDTVHEYLAWSYIDEYNVPQS